MTKTVLFQGDSITDCGRARIEITDPAYLRSGLGLGYPYLIAARLLCDRGEDFNFYNFVYERPNLFAVQIHVRRAYAFTSHFKHIFLAFVCFDDFTSAQYGDFINLLGDRIFR